MPHENMEGFAVHSAPLPGRGNVVGNHSPETIATIAQELLKTREFGLCLVQAAVERPLSKSISNTFRSRL